MSHLICEEVQKLDFDKHINLQKDKSTQLSLPQLAEHDTSVCGSRFSGGERGGEGGRGKRKGHPQTTSVLTGARSGGCEVTEVEVWPTGSMSFLFRDQPHTLPGGTQHTIGAGHQLHFLRNTDGLQAFITLKMFSLFKTQSWRACSDGLVKQALGGLCVCVRALSTSVDQCHSGELFWCLPHVTSSFIWRGSFSLLTWLM